MKRIILVLCLASTLMLAPRPAAHASACDAYAVLGPVMPGGIGASAISGIVAALVERFCWFELAELPNPGQTPGHIGSW